MTPSRGLPLFLKYTNVKTPPTHPNTHTPTHTPHTPTIPHSKENPKQQTCRPIKQNLSDPLPIANEMTIDALISTFLRTIALY